MKDTEKQFCWQLQQNAPTSGITHITAPHLANLCPQGPCAHVPVTYSYMYFSSTTQPLSWFSCFLYLYTKNVEFPPCLLIFCSLKHSVHLDVTTFSQPTLPHSTNPDAPRVSSETLVLYNSIFTYFKVYFIRRFKLFLLIYI